MSFRNKRSDKKQFITITSSNNLYGYEVLAEAVAVLEANANSKYNTRAIAWSSLKIEYAVYNPDGF